MSEDSAPVIISESAREKLRRLVARIERQEDEKAEIAEGIKETYAEAKAFGFDTKALRALIRRRKIDRAELEEQQAILELYEEAVDGIVKSFV